MRHEFEKMRPKKRAGMADPSSFDLAV